MLEYIYKCEREPTVRVGEGDVAALPDQLLLQLRLGIRLAQLHLLLLLLLGNC